MIREYVTECLERILHLDLPETVLHGDLNLGNIVRTVDGRCQFIDWSETYVGTCVAALPQLLQLGAPGSADSSYLDSENLKRLYLMTWRQTRQTAALEKSLPYIPVLGAISALHGRGDWLPSSERRSARWEFTRRLVTKLDRTSNPIPSGACDVVGRTQGTKSVERLSSFGNEGEAVSC
ncbi:phosphotransferase family protein [Silvibacterium acidisoli]|uniref:phosphotransferase family protein n=1 Tax=Acidobacteriaceae bacterium ZG23-2 TaxID=2883246 RepID=UPI00406C1881